MVLEFLKPLFDFSWAKNTFPSKKDGKNFFAQKTSKIFFFLIFINNIKKKKILEPVSTFFRCLVRTLWPEKWSLKVYFWKFFKNQGIIVWDRWGAYFEDWVEVFPKKNIWKILDVRLDLCEWSKSGKNAKNANFGNFLKIRVSSYGVPNSIFM